MRRVRNGHKRALPPSRALSGAADVRGYDGLGSPGVIIGGLVLVGLGLLLFFKRKDVVTTVTKITDQASWAKAVYDAIGRVLPHLSVTSKLMMVAHAGYETGWGRAGAAKFGHHNIFNITSGSSWRGSIDIEPNGDLSYDANECAKLGRPMTTQKNGRQACRIDQKWRAYPSLDAAIADYWSLLGRTSKIPGKTAAYIDARNALEAGNIALFGQKLYEAGYFTLDPSEYTSQLVGVIATARRFVGV